MEDFALKAIGVFLSSISVAAAVYNMLTARSRQKQLKQEDKVEDAILATATNTTDIRGLKAASVEQRKQLDSLKELARTNRQDITNLKERMDTCDERTERRLNQIGADIAAVKEMFTKFLIDNLRQLGRP